MPDIGDTKVTITVYENPDEAHYEEMLDTVIEDQQPALWGEEYLVIPESLWGTLVEEMRAEGDSEELIETMRVMSRVQRPGGVIYTIKAKAGAALLVPPRPIQDGQHR